MSDFKQIHGWLNIYKPLGITSAQVVGEIRRALGKKQKTGHAGTLDPLASGVLPIALGEATKTVFAMMDARKTYGFTATWGEARDTDDAEGKVIESSPNRPTEDQIRAILPQFTGRISQTPPAYSAIKVDGERAYDLARAGEEVTLKAREIDVYSIEIKEFNSDSCAFETACGKGTYIRSLARDMARALGTCGYVSRLERLRVGPFSAENAISLDLLKELAHSPRPAEALANAGKLLPLTVVLNDISAHSVSDDDARKIRHGQTIALRGQADSTETCVLHNGLLVAFGQIRGGVFHSQRVFNYEQ